MGKQDRKDSYDRKRRLEKEKDDKSKAERLRLKQENDDRKAEEKAKAARVQRDGTAEFKRKQGKQRFDDHMECIKKAVGVNGGRRGVRRKHEKELIAACDAIFKAWS